MFRRSRFAPIVETQLDVFVRENRELIDEARERLAAYNRADRSEAEELYGDYVDTIEAGTEALADMRDHYAATVSDPDAYVHEFNRAVARRLPAFAGELENR
jgi:hypothetical protein